MSLSVPAHPVLLLERHMAMVIVTMISAKASHPPCQVQSASVTGGNRPSHHCSRRGGPDGPDVRRRAG